ncbi:MAG TPA: ATP-binding protein, partial [Candidatus Acidoferrales bacterium]|nr:ATP-binding protein [Candidatus Acidoferrales bacterium]
GRDDQAREELRQRGECAPYEKEFFRKDGTRLSVLIGAAVVTREPLECVCIALDLSAQKAMEEERERALAAAQEANVMKDEFLAVLSHELRSPLSAILGWVSVLKRAQISATDFKRAIDAIERNVHLQTQLVNDLLDVSRIISGKLLMEHKPVDFVGIVQRTAEGFRALAESKGVRLETRLGGHPAVVFGDEKRLEQIVQNLIANAVKFTGSGGNVVIELASHDGYARLGVRDTGEGIDAEFLPHLFERFRQADATRARKHGGLGLGLSIVKHLVDIHGGHVSATSAGVGRGATFQVRLPITGNELLPVSRQSKIADEAGLHGVHILLVDDDNDTREALRLILENRGATVLVAPSAADGLRALALDLPDVIVSDVAMPGEDGYSFVRHVRERWGSAVSAVAITGFASDEDREAALRAGFNDHITKPLDLDLLIYKIRHFAQARGPNI